MRAQARGQKREPRGPKRRPTARQRGKRGSRGRCDGQVSVRSPATNQFINIRKVARSSVHMARRFLSLSAWFPAWQLCKSHGNRESRTISGTRARHPGAAQREQSPGRAVRRMAGAPVAHHSHAGTAPHRPSAPRPRRAGRPGPPGTPGQTAHPLTYGGPSPRGPVVRRTPSGPAWCSTGEDTTPASGRGRLTRPPPRCPVWLLQCRLLARRTPASPHARARRAGLA